jgi:hypothetical protein
MVAQPRGSWPVAPSSPGLWKGLPIVAYWSGCGVALAPNASTPAEGYGVDDAAEDDGDAGSCAGLE